MSQIFNTVSTRRLKVSKKKLSGRVILKLVAHGAVVSEIRVHTGVVRVLALVAAIVCGLLESH